MDSIILSYDEIVFLTAVAFEVKSTQLHYPGNKHMLAAMSEEAGELAKAFIDHDRGECSPQELRNEAVQTAAMALRCAVEGDQSFKYTPPVSSLGPRDYGPMLWLFNEVMVERLRQDARWGGPLHDDQHSKADWCSFIEKQVIHCVEEQSGITNKKRFELRMIKIIALAVAAIESSERIHVSTT